MPAADKQQLLIMMCGTLGAGKSHFSRHLAKKIGAKRVNVDAFRRLLFQTVEEWLLPENNKRVYTLLDKHTEKALLDGYSVIRDARHDSRAAREKARCMAAQIGALAIAVWIKTPPDLAIARALARPEAPDTIKLDEDFIKSRARKHAETIEPPDEDELAIEIDGRTTLSEQIMTFENYLSQILTSGNHSHPLSL